MIYKFLTLADIHWGAMDTIRLRNNLELVLEFIRQMKDNLDLIVIAGDYFDYRLQLNSKSALTAIKWFNDFINTCKESNVKRVRIIKGTNSHDNDQLEAFRTYETDNFFKIFNTTESEETLPGLYCIYCPDENMNLEDYDRIYPEKFFPNPNIGFFHGNFDCILPSIEYDRIQTHKLNTMIYKYDTMSRLIKGPLIAGHYHIATDYESLYYVGSFDRWKFNEEEDKGFLYGEIDTETGEYFIHRIVNPLAITYKTIIEDSKYTNTPEQFANLLIRIRDLLSKDPQMMIRVTYLLSEENPEAVINFNLFQKRCLHMKQVKVVFKDLIKKAIKGKKKKMVEIEVSKYDYIFNKDPSKIPDIIHQYIMDTKSVDIPKSTIEKYISKYIS